MKNYDSEHSLIEQLLMHFKNDESTAFDDVKSEKDIALRVKQFIDEIPGGFLIYRADDSEKILYANKALLSIFRCENFAEFLAHTGGTFRGLVYSEDLNSVEASIRQQINDNADDLDYVEYRIPCADGAVRWVEDYGHFVHTRYAGDIFYVFISDATEKIQRRINEKTAIINEGRERTQKLQNIIEEYDKENRLVRREHLQRLEVIEGLSINYDSILYADLDADTVFPYRLSSRTEKQFEGKFIEKDYGAFIAAYTVDWVSPEDREHFAKKLAADNIKEAMKATPTFYVNYRCVENGVVKYMQIRIVNVGGKEHSSRIVIGVKIIDDEILSEIKQKQLLAAALESAKIADVAKSTFLSNMSHDMRTPLNAITGYTALARKNLDNPEAVESYLNKIDEASNHILDLIKNVLDVSYLETHDFVVKESECDVTEIISEVYTSVLSKAAQKSIAVTLRTQSLSHTRVLTDRDKLKQILVNIADNAVKFTNDGGRVTLTVTEEKAGDEFATYRFVCEDNGIGISQENLTRIFEPFERECDSTSSGKFGAGLGLTIAKHTADMMGGTICVESVKDEGSKFTLTIVLRVLDCSNALPENDFKKTELTGKKILLVEDNEINREIETEILEDYGFIVDTAENGKICVDKISASAVGEYSLVLMDIQMPVMNGREATLAIRSLQNRELAQIPIIALSANALESDKRASIETGMNAHLAKPIDVHLLIKTMAKVLSGRKPLN